jgi:uncharacterized membrane protein YdbT with pleckstrin-like domain
VDTHPGEKILFEGHPSWRSILGFYVKGLLLAAVAGGIAALVTRIADDHVRKGWVIAVALVVFGLVLVVGLLKRISTTYVITNQRLHIKRGIVARKVQETRLERVQNVNTNQSAFERVLQVGTVDFDTAGTEDSDFTFAGVAQPEKVSHAVDQAMREVGGPGPGGGLPGDPVPAPAPPPRQPPGEPGAGV